MSKRNISDIVTIGFLLFFMIHSIGIKCSVDLFYQIIRFINNILTSFFNTSILNKYFKYFITFPIVGIIFSEIGLSRGKIGHLVGRIIYFAVGYVVVFLLDIVAKIVF